MVSNNVNSKNIGNMYYIVNQGTDFYDSKQASLLKDIQKGEEDSKE
jgi:hypothetical protein